MRTVGAAAGSADVAANSLRNLFIQNFKAAAPSALVTTGLALPFYLTQYSPEQAIGLAALDAGASALLGAGVGSAVSKLRNKGTQLAVNPEFQRKLDLLKVQPGANIDEINAAYRAAKKNTIKQYPDLSETNANQSIGAQKIRELQQAAKDLKSPNPDLMFTQVPVDSKLVNLATTVPDVLFTAFAMPKIEQFLAENNITNPNYNLNQGLIPQKQVIQQQLTSASNLGTPNNAVLSNGTMSQQSNAEPGYVDPDQLMTQLLQQAMNEKNASINTYSLDNYVSV